MTKLNIRVAGMIDSPVYRLGIAGVLKEIPGITYTGNTDSENMNQFLEEFPSDVLLVSTRKKSAFNMRLFLDVRSLFKELKIVFFLNTTGKEELRQYRDFELNGFLLKSISIAELEYALKTIHQKGFYISQGISGEVIDYFLSKEEDTSKNFEKLTRREQQIMMMIYHEFATGEIAEKLKISRRTVEGHRLSIMQKIGVRNNIGIVKYVARNEEND